ncbi:MAG: tRNA uridine-5-carboxymethylaminomethyl(34) synthesis enzyme MnmG [Thermovirgaceae bacterium]
MKTDGNERSFDVIVVGAGHAGCEAALAAARMGERTLLLNLYLDNMALMACNPSIGGPAKGHLTREIDALGGEQGRATDAATLHIRWLNTSKGPAVRTLRAQCDLGAYHRWYKKVCEMESNLSLRQEQVTDLWVEDGKVRGVKTQLGTVYESPAVILTTGTYLGGRVFIGTASFPSGPLGQMAATELTASIERAGLVAGRLKTGTTPRIHSGTVDWKSLDRQDSAPEPLRFSHWGEKKKHEGFACFMTRSTDRTHDIIRANLDRSPLFSGVIKGIGPRYCPSIEDRVVRFPDKASHLVFLEPVARENAEIYMQNFTTSLPFDAQVRMVRSLPGCEKAWIMRPGYAIEYDYLPPTQLYPWLESKHVCGLFCAGQINGTSGYEEAGAQGLLAGINAVLRRREEGPLVLERSQAYAGVLVDDLVTRGTEEPYRMLTSRCEFRLLLRHDNADRRLAPIGRKLGLVDDERWAGLLRRWKDMEREIHRLENVKIPARDSTNAVLEAAGSSPLSEPAKASDLLKRPEVTWKMIAEIAPPPEPLDEEITTAVSVEIKYEGYIDRQKRQVERMRKMERVRLPADFDYDGVPGLLSESRQKLKKLRPRTLAQAGRVSGVTPADLHILWVNLERGRRRGEKADDAALEE